MLRGLANERASRQLRKLLPRRAESTAARRTRASFQTAPSQCFPSAVVNASSRREKERPSLDPMSNPWRVAFPLRKLSLTRHGPCNEWFADRGKMHQINDARRSDDARFDVSPRCPSTGPQTFPANIAFVGFGGSCFGDRHEEKMIDAAEKCEAIASGCVTFSLLSDRSFAPSVRDIERLSRQFLMRRVRSREDRPV